MKVDKILLDSPVCNFKCSYCGLCADHEETRKHLPQAITNFDVIDRIIETEYSGKKYRDGSLDIHLWGGEPLFNQNFWPLIEHLNKTFKLHSVEFVTNGSLIYPYRKELHLRERFYNPDIYIDIINYHEEKHHAHDQSKI